MRRKGEKKCVQTRRGLRKSCENPCLERDELVTRTYLPQRHSFCESSTTSSSSISFSAPDNHARDVISPVTPRRASPTYPARPGAVRLVRKLPFAVYHFACTSCCQRDRKRQCRGRPFFRKQPLCRKETNRSGQCEETSGECAVG